MVKCKICGKRGLKDPKNPAHIGSARHQQATLRLLLKERVYDFISRSQDGVSISEVLSHFQKFFDKEKINSLSLELYFENLVEFEDKVPSEMEEILMKIRKEKELSFPLSLRVKELKNIVEKYYMDFDRVTNILRENKDFVEFSSLSIGEGNDLVTFKRFWNLDSLVRGVER